LLSPPAMTAEADPLLQAAIMALAPPGVLIGHRLITPGDESALLPPERPALAASVVKVQRASGAARLVARDLLARLGNPGAALPKSSSGAPQWPDGVIGSLAHDEQVAVAAVATKHDVAALGIDIEPAEPLPHDLLELVTTPQERLNLARDPFHGRLHFVVKEAVYKVVHPIDGIFLEHHDVQVDLASLRASIRNGRIVEFRFCLAPRLVALAFFGTRSHN
jgi:4'-phosphopantetheinyl transferase EntD